MPIFRYTFKKTLLSVSTWVVLGLTIGILSVSWLTIAHSIKFDIPNDSWTQQLVKTFYLGLWENVGFLTLAGLMLLIFIGIKGVQIFRDEIEDGTLLILVSKPVSRNRIWLEKWLCFQLITFIYLFFSCLVPNLFLLLPSVGNLVFFKTIIPYVFILLGISVLFGLIFTSVVILLTLIINGKAVIAIMIGTAALTNIFVLVVDKIAVTIPDAYFSESQAVEVYQVLKKDLGANSDAFDWLNKELEIGSYYKTGETNWENYTKNIHEYMVVLYNEVVHQPYSNAFFNPILEQAALKKVMGSESGTYHDLDNAAKNLNVKDGKAATAAKYILEVSNVFRQSKTQSVEILLTGAINDNSSFIVNNFNQTVVRYSVQDMYNALVNPKNSSNGYSNFSKEEVDNFKSQVTDKSVMRYFNIFYQLSYLFNGIIDNSHNTLFTDNYSQADDPYIISFQENSDGTYSANVNSSTHKILNFDALLSVYIILAGMLLATSWYVFRKKDFA